MDTSTPSRIVSTPGVCGGRARIAGHRIRVLDVVVFSEHRGMTPDEIVSHFPSITLGDVHAALSYYFDHMDEIREEMRVENAFAEQMREKHPSLIDAKLRLRTLEEAS